MRYLRTIIFALALIFSSACVDNLELPTPNIDNSSSINVIGRTTIFDDYNVETRSAKTAEESRITSYAMAIFPIVNNAVGNCVYYEVKSGSQLLFNLNRISGPYEYNQEYAIYIFANMPELTTADYNGVGKPLSEMLGKTLDLTSSKLDIPQNGFPMIGSLGDYVSTDIDNDGNQCIISPEPILGEDGNEIFPAPLVGPKGSVLTNSSTLQIPMKALFSKINFEIEVRPDQIIEGGFVPSFQLSSCQIVNVPKYVDFKKDVINKDSTYNKNFWQSSLSVENAGGVASGANKIKFSFYLPENLIKTEYTPDTYDYPFKQEVEDENGNINKIIREEDEKYRQRYKVKLLNVPDDPNNKNLLNQATNIVLTGEFKDHQSHTVEVTYTIYLGQDNYSNFDITRNGEYYNYITIRGILNSDDKSGGDSDNYISLDHRVNIKHDDPVIIALRREVLLDSHFEVRPLRIKKNTQLDGDLPTHVKVEVINPTLEDGELEATDWIRLERSFNDGNPNNDPITTIKKTDGTEESVSIYIDEDPSSPSYGKRRFFTYNLIDGVNATEVDATLKDSYEVFVPITDAGECVWIYVDECTDFGDALRSGNIEISYWVKNYESGEYTKFVDKDNKFPTINYSINQRKLFRVEYLDKSKNKTRYYDIEYFEEYLHNFDADEEYGHTEYEGMEWGLEGIQLSRDNKALYFDTSYDFINGIIDWIKGNSGVNPVYDFYIPKHDTKVSSQAIKRAYRGDIFSNEIIQEVNGASGYDTDITNDIDVLTLNEKPNSAVEYCYNKNKRNAAGQVVWMKENTTTYDQSQLNWYLPAIDEIEDIVMSSYSSGNTTNNTYGRFLEFQDKYYWSSQPSYIRNYARYQVVVDIPGEYYYDDKSYARATKVDKDFNYELSGTTGYYHALRIYNTSMWDILSPKYAYYETTEEYPYSGIELGTISRQPGNKKRTDKARVRCVRKSEYTETNSQN